MGPRNRRRVTRAGLAVAAVALVVAAVLHTRPHHPKAAPSGSKTPAAASFTTAAAASDDSHVPANHYERGHVVGKLVFGMTKQQVLNHVGKPIKVITWQGMPCWQYDINEHVPAGPGGPGYTMNATAACFLAGSYATSRYKIDGKWGYNRRTKKVTD